MARSNTNLDIPEATMVAYVCPQCGNRIGAVGATSVACYRANLHTPRAKVLMDLAPETKARVTKALSLAR